MCHLSMTLSWSKAGAEARRAQPVLAQLSNREVSKPPSTRDSTSALGEGIVSDRELAPQREV